MGLRLNVGLKMSALLLPGTSPSMSILVALRKLTTGCTQLCIESRCDFFFLMYVAA